jgi:hypothetical protein
MQAERRRRLTIIGILGVIVILLILLWPRDRLLLQRATKVTRGHTGKNEEIPVYQWLSNREAVLLRRDEGSNVQFMHLDVSNGTEKQMPGWSSDQMLVSWQSTSAPFRLCISPDRKRLLWEQPGINATWLFGGGARMDGTHSFTLGVSPHIDLGQIFWLSDSLHWVEITNAWTGGADTIRAYRYSFDRPAEAHPELVSLPPASSIDGMAIYSMVSDHRMLGHELFRADELTPGLKFVDMSLNTDRPTAHAFRLSAPPNAKIHEMEFSPSGDRVAWLVEQEQASPLTTLLGRWIPRLNTIPRTKMSLWICRLDGSQMHEIGYVPLISEDSPMPENLDWLPDGQRISFTSKGALYTVSAD